MLSKNFHNQELPRFLGLTGILREFVEDYSLISRPLTKLTAKVSKSSFTWGPEQQKAFERLIEILSSDPVLTLYDVSAKHEVHTDACSVGLAAVLLQSVDDGKTWKPIMYFSRHCTAD